MSWWIYLLGWRGNVLPVPAHNEGATQKFNSASRIFWLQITGQVYPDNDRAEMNVTYNYGRYFDFKALHGKRAKDTMRCLEAAVELLGTVQDDNYWNPTPGNVGYCCSILLKWAQLHPTGKWRVS
jgi:hypothetical protein